MTQAHRVIPYEDYLFDLMQQSLSAPDTLPHHKERIVQNVTTLRNEIGNAGAVLDMPLMDNFTD